MGFSSYTNNDINNNDSKNKYNYKSCLQENEILLNNNNTNNNTYSYSSQERQVKSNQNIPYNNNINSTNKHNYPIMNTNSMQKKPFNKAIMTKLKMAKKQGIINLSNMNLDYLPHEIFDDEIRFDDINWWDIVDITKIDATNNNITDSLFESNEYKMLDFSNIPALNYLKFTNNKFNNIPQSILSLQNIKYLDFSNNKISSISNNIKALTSLVEFNVSKNYLIDIPIDIFTNLTNLEVLDLSCNKISKFHTYNIDYKNIKNRLKIVNLSDNLIEGNLNFSLFYNCEQVYMFKNKICYIDFNNATYNNLMFLDLHSNQLNSTFIAPKAIKLDSLILGYNKIDEVINLYNCLNLTVFDINNNNISSFPNEIIVLDKLKTLNIQNNNLNDVPALICFINSLVRLSIEGNPMRKLNSKLRSSNTEQIKSYLKTRVTEEDINYYKKLRKELEVVNPNIISNKGKSIDIEIDSTNNILDLKNTNLGNYYHNNCLKLNKLNLNEIPEDVLSINGISNIVSLDLSYNKLKYIDSLYLLIKNNNNNLKNLREFIVNNNQLINLLSNNNNNINNILIIEFLNLKCLKLIELKHNNLTTFLDDIISTSNLHNIVTKNPLVNNDNNNNISKINNEFNFFTNNVNSIYNNPNSEQYIDPNNKDDNTFVPNYTQGVFTSLDYLDLSYNKLLIVPNILINFINIKNIYLSNNNISECSNVFCKNSFFPSLQTLDLSNNKLVNFSKELYKITPELCSLNIDNNNIKIIPTDLCLLQLKHISISGNPLKQIRMNIIQGGSKCINEYILKMHPFTDEEKMFYENKIKNNNKKPVIENNYKLNNAFNNNDIDESCSNNVVNNTCEYQNNIQNNYNNKNTNNNLSNTNINYKKKFNLKEHSKTIHNINNNINSNKFNTTKSNTNLNNYDGSSNINAVENINNQITQVEKELASDPKMEIFKKKDLKSKLIALIKERSKLLK